VTRAPISFADYLLAAERLGAKDPDTRRRVAAMLGFDWRAKQTAQTQAAPTPGTRVSTGASQGVLELTDLQAQSTGRAETKSDATETVGEAEDLWLEDLPPRNVRLPKWVSEVQPMPEPTAEEKDEPPEVEPLFMPRWTRALLYAALAHVDDNGAIDIDLAVERLSRFEHVTRLPRRRRFHLKNDLQLLIDISPTMAPFAQDQFALIANIKRLVSAQNVEQLYFSGCPTRGAGSADEWPLRAYRAPRHPGTLVVVLTDLCASRAGPGIEAANTDEWLSFARLIVKGGCQSVALVPFPLRRVRPALRRAMSVVPWDRSTTTGAIQKIRFTGRQKLSV
jgi:hypothetical protein